MQPACCGLLSLRGRLEPLAWTPSPTYQLLLCIPMWRRLIGISEITRPNLSTELALHLGCPLSGGQLYFSSDRSQKSWSHPCLLPSLTPYTWSPRAFEALPSKYIPNPAPSRHLHSATLVLATVIARLNSSSCLLAGPLASVPVPHTSLS